MNKYDKITIDKSKTLHTNINFARNKEIPFHRWYPFVEGFSEQFIYDILHEIKFKEIYCLEPFVGSGTTPLALQRVNIPCESYEVNPFMHLLAKGKMVTNYTLVGLKKTIEVLRKEINISYCTEGQLVDPPIMSSMINNGQRQKWLFHNESMSGLLDIKFAISKVQDSRYKNLCKIVLASILLKVSNVYRNGKCVSYKDNWNTTVTSREKVIDLYFDSFQNIIKDITDFINNQEKTSFSNAANCYLGDVKSKLLRRKGELFNLIITSPPYLNSRDYTDSYMIELWMLDLVSSYDDVRKLRNKTIKSHVQVRWEDNDILNISSLKKSYNEILEHKDDFWNNSIPNMIIGYFNDMDLIFKLFNQQMIKDGKIYFNIANSAYYGVNIPTDEIIAEIAENNGFNIDEIRIARKIAPSSQQKLSIDYLRESVILMTKKN
jgi:hypothetical protein